MTRSAHYELWGLDPTVTFLNHGSFGGVPKAIREVQADLHRRADREPVDFFVRYLPEGFRRSREALGAFVNADPDDLVFVSNATSGVNTVMKSLSFEPGDELLTTSQAYGACRHTLDHVADTTGAKVVSAPLPFPIASPEQITEAILACVTDRTKIAMLDHIASPTGLVFPIAEIVAALHERGVDTLVDGAHSVGQVPLDLEAIGAAYFTTNAHKWLCTPRGAAILHVRKDRQDRVVPLVTSHAYHAKEDRFRAQFDWTGTDDPTAHLVIPEAIAYLGGLLEGGWPALYAAIHERAVQGRRVILERLGLESPSPDAMHGSLAPILLPDGDGEVDWILDPLSRELWDDHRIEVPVFPFPKAPKRMLRVSAHLYNAPGDYERLAEILAMRLPGGSSAV